MSPGQSRTLAAAPSASANSPCPIRSRRPIGRYGWISKRYAPIASAANAPTFCLKANVSPASAPATTIQRRPPPAWCLAIDSTTPRVARIAGQDGCGSGKIGAASTAAITGTAARRTATVRRAGSGGRAAGPRGRAHGHQHPNRLDGQAEEVEGPGEQVENAGRVVTVEVTVRQVAGLDAAGKVDEVPSSIRSTQYRPDQTYSAKMAAAATATATISARETRLIAGLSTGTVTAHGPGGAARGSTSAWARGGLRGAGGGQRSSGCDGRATSPAKSRGRRRRRAE